MTQPDAEPEDAEHPWASGHLRSVLTNLDAGGYEADEFIRIDDEDNEPMYFRVRDIAAFEVPDYLVDGEGDRGGGVDMRATGMALRVVDDVRRRSSSETKEKDADGSD
jgi:hypothetical protein